MGKVESKERKNLKASLNCNVKDQIQCPICNKILNGRITYNQLNIHLKICDNNIHSKLNKNIKESSHKNLGAKNYEDILDQKYINEIKVDLKMNNLNYSEPRRKHKKSSINSSGDMGTINDFQLVIDYNNTKNPDLYEEKLKNDGKKQQIIDKYTQLRRFLFNKKNLMNYDLNIECKNYKEIFISLKNSNIYYNLKFILYNENNSNTNTKKKKPKVISLNVILNKYFEFMLKNKYYSLINNTLYFSLNSKTVDYEMLGIIISILIIYPEIKLNYKLPLILCKILVNQRLELDDIKYINSDLYNNLYLLSRDKNIDSKGLVYFYEGDELLIDGKNVKVNSSNVFDYIEKIINYHIKNYKNEINIIKSSLFEFIPKKYIFYFNGEDIYRIINRSL